MWKHRIVAILMLASSSAVARSTQTVVKIIQSEQETANGIFDKGSLTVTVNGLSESVGYGQFSTDTSLASAIAAKFSQDCNSSVVAYANGPLITFVTKNPGVTISQPVATLAWDGQDFSAASFAMLIPAVTPPASTPGITCVPSTIVSGQNLTCDVPLVAGASSSVTFSINGTNWTTAFPDPTGNVVANASLTEAAPGVYTIAYNYPGDPNIPGTSGTAQVNVAAAGSEPSGTGIYSFAIVDQYGHSGYAPNNNITAYTDSVNGNWTLGYDDLNRLTSSSQISTNGVSHWGCWGYDSFGNMTTQGISSQVFASLTSCQPQAGANTLQSVLAYNTANQISSGTWLDSSNNTHSGAPQYDAAGDLKNDLLNKYLYDPRGQLCAVQTGASTYIGYLYDAEGHRVAKGSLQALTCDTTNLQITATYFVGPDGETMTEMDANGSWVRTEVSAAGQYIATYTPTGLHFPITDWLGTKRVTVNPNLALNNGIEESCSSYPFGDQLLCTTPIDASPRHLTGKERDAESGLDYFGARYNVSNMGRFISPDPIPLSIEIDAPQTWNKYVYVFNNPLTMLDPDGRWPTWYHTEVDRNFFGNQLHLSLHDQNVIIDQSASQDGFFNDGQMPWTSAHHGMQNGWELGDPVAAIAATHAYIASELNLAVEIEIGVERYGPTGYGVTADGALQHFANALHATQDLDSPEHGGNPWWGDPITGIVHWWQEKHSATSSKGSDEEARAETIYDTQVLWGRYQVMLDDARKKQQKRDCQENPQACGGSVGGAPR